MIAPPEGVIRYGQYVIWMEGWNYLADAKKLWAAIRNIWLARARCNGEWILVDIPLLRGAVDLDRHGVH